MGTIARGTKSGTGTTDFGTGTTILASEVNADFNTVFNVVNGNLDDDNLANDAVTTAKITDLNVTTGKLAANAVTTAKITDLNVTTGKLADLAVTTGKMAVGAAVPTSVAEVMTTFATSGTSETDLIIAPAITTRGGTVFIVPTIPAWLVGTSAAAGNLTIRYYRGATNFYTIAYSIIMPTYAFAGTMPVTIPPLTNTPAAGTYVYKITAQVSSATFSLTASSIAAGVGGIRVLELA